MKISKLTSLLTEKYVLFGFHKGVGFNGIREKFDHQIIIAHHKMIALSKLGHFREKRLK